MATAYISNCDWRFIKSRRRSPARDLPERIERWIGREDQLETFLALYPTGTARSGGYVVDQIVDDEVPRSEADLVVAMPPDFLAYLAANGTSIKTVTLSAGSLGVTYHDAEITDAERRVSFVSPETRYTYFASTAPLGPRFATLLSTIAIRPLRSMIIGRGVDDSGNPREFPFTGVTAPAGLVSALALTTIEQVVHSADPIAGTPWYRCTDVVSLEYAGDA